MLIALGLTALIYAWPDDSWQALRPLRWSFAMLWLVAGALLGAGVLTPFRHPILGAIVGLAFQGLMLAVALAYVTVVVHVFAPTM